MILKSADAKSKRIALLEDLQRSTLLDAYQRTWLSEELERFKKGILGERINNGRLRRACTALPQYKQMGKLFVQFSKIG